MNGRLKKIWRIFAILVLNRGMTAPPALVAAINRLRKRQKALDWAAERVSSEIERDRFLQQAADLWLVLDELEACG